MAQQQQGGGEGILHFPAYAPSGSYAPLSPFPCPVPSSSTSQQQGRTYGGSSSSSLVDELRQAVEVQTSDLGASSSSSSSSTRPVHHPSPYLNKI
jgi:hypothetical protein